MNLKRCPFCGQDAVLFGTAPPCVRLGCPGPGSECVCPEARGETLAEAVQRWNMRAERTEQ